ncbi:MULTISPECIES: DMT family transporter [Anoxybacillaceae]|jgi:drug/metabolite transporter (DMT)-like permease|uniref:DMT family transporter n=1 Tax=Anoxybacillaceae TaxID=3120669 RepID=UPI0013160973|nr:MULTISPECIES: DMT family transporter [Anoxybacillus]MBS2771153.1 DMT family transporter [Anoxybacillus rupiensis]QHC05447.1 EamA family transporter [Anoxybacillus sp. PDR2]
MNESFKILVNARMKKSTKGTSSLGKNAIPWLFVFMWSSGAIFVEFGLHDADPFIFLFFRLFISSLLFWITMFILRTPLPTTSTEWLYMMFTGLCMQAGYQTFYFLALDYKVSPGLLTIILGAQPILTTFISKEKSNITQWLGLFIGIMGLVLVVIDHTAINSFSKIGLVSSFLSLICITGGTILQKSIQANQISNMAIQYTSGTIFLSILLYFFDQKINWTPMFVFSLFWMVFVISVGATLLLYQMIKKGNLTNVTSLFYCVPPITVIFDFFVFKNSLTMLSISGMLLIVLGMILVNRKGKWL